MAIRTQVTDGVRRVITKVVNGQRRVSCSCCAEEQTGCCMYPADQFGILYGASDLPDSIFVSPDPSEEGFDEAIRDGVNFVIENRFAQGEDVVVGLYNGQWRWWVDAGSGPDFILGDYSNNCLINWPYSESNRVPAIQDGFAYTYTLEAAEVVVLTRQSLCVWSGEGEKCGYELIYSDRGGQYWGNGEPCKWTVQWILPEFCGEGALLVKESSQSSPVGTYSYPDFPEVAIIS